MLNRKSASFALILFVIFAVSIVPSRTSAEVTSASVMRVGGSALLNTDYPVRLLVPSVNIDSPIQGLGVNTRGEMAVPSGSTNNVGWYKDGTVPGQVGSAVLDAHIFAAFSNLRYLKPNSDVYVIMQSGMKLHFITSAAMIYSLNELPSIPLFNLNDTERLNLITCAGKPTKDGSTYDHRLVIYTRLADISA